MTTVVEAFRQARIHAARHMAACEAARLTWGEPAITEVVIAQAAKAPAVTVYPFTQRAEAISGADWIWWCVDRTSAYGMLVQAKRLTLKGGRWGFDFGYRIGGTKSGRLQREVLCSTAQQLNLLPVYALYLGTGDYRQWTPCPADHHRGRCLGCVKRAVSLMPALLASDLIDSATSTYESSVALEELWTPTTKPTSLLPILKTRLAPDLSEFLQSPQQGTRAVTRAMIERVLQQRAAHFSAATATYTTLGGHDKLGPVFNQVPDDKGHFNIPYFSHVLDPLLRTTPDYVLELMTSNHPSEHPPPRVPDNVSGIVVVRSPNIGAPDDHTA